MIKRQANEQKNLDFHKKIENFPGKKNEIYIFIGAKLTKLSGMTGARNRKCTYFCLRF